jgi:hypothetical protein
MEDGGIDGGDYEPPILQGRFVSTTNAMIAFATAHGYTGNARYRKAADRALQWLVANRPETTQDRVYKLLALARSGRADHQHTIRSLAEDLSADQQTNGGWKERPELKGPNAYATGQALFALKQAGISIHSSIFRRGIAFLLDTQVHHTSTTSDGSWPATNTQSQRTSDFAPTMWAVTGLAGSFGTRTTGGLQVVTNLQRDQPASRNLEIVLDVSGSMNQSLGQLTRWQTALGVLEKVVTALPADYSVGLRVYGHRYSSRAPETCTDSELVVPIAALDRKALLSAARRVKPRGETPLVHSVVQTAADLEGLGRASVILITDGEESCGGDLNSVAPTLKASGLSITLHIVGFALQEQKVRDGLTGLARATGGTYYDARSGEELARALRIAAIQSLPYEIVDASGQTVASRRTSLLSEELAAGVYRVVVHAPDQELATGVTVGEGRDTVVTVILANDRFAFAR